KTAWRIGPENTSTLPILAQTRIGQVLVSTCQRHLRFFELVVKYDKSERRQPNASFFAKWMFLAPNLSSLRLIHVGPLPSSTWHVVYQNILAGASVAACTTIQCRWEPQGVDPVSRTP